MPGERCPVLFDAVGGHKSSIFYGEATHDGRSTLRKTTTAWEIIYYLAMELAKEDALAQQPSTTPPCGDDTRAKFIRAAGKMAAFTSTLFSIHFPEKYTARSPALKMYLENADEWVIVETGAPARNVVLAPLFDELFDGAQQLRGFDDRYDTRIWGIGLVDETSGMQRPCVMDVKIGFIRHSPLTPEDKVARILKKDERALVRETALRICGCRRYIYGAAGTEDASATLTCERFGKDIGYAVSNVRELSTCLKVFLSIGAPLAETNADGQLAFPFEQMAAVGSTERRCMKQRISHACAEIKSLVDFFKGTPDGVFMLQHMAFVSSSVLVLYDAAAVPATASVRLIDFARSTWRKFNFEEPVIGFTQGLENLENIFSF